MSKIGSVVIAVLLYFLGMPGLGMPGFALAVTTLKQVQVSNGTQVDLLFDSKLTKQQVQTEFFNDIIQLSLTESSVYPAKISSVSGGDLLKVFAYQYAPKLVRCRFTVKGKAEDYKDRFQVNLSGKLLTVRLSDGEIASDRINLGAAQAARVVPGSAGDNSPSAKAPSGSNNGGGGPAISPEEKSLMQRVLAANPALDASRESKPAPESIKEASKELPKEALKSAESPAPAPKSAESEIKLQHKPLGGAKPLPSPLGVLGKLALVLGLFGLLALAVRKFRGGSRRDANLLSAIGNFAKTGIGRQLGKKEKMIEVLTTHYLGPKKSIAVVRVFGRVLVLAVANESISLITQLPDGNGDGLSGIDDLDLEQLGIPAAPGALSGGLGATAAGPAVFADLLKRESHRPASPGRPSAASAYSFQLGQAGQSGQPGQFAARGMTGAPAPAANGPSVTIGAARAGDHGVRAQIRNRLEGLKQL